MKLSQHFSKAAKFKVAIAQAAAAVGLLALMTMAAMATTRKTVEFLPLNVHVGERAPDFALPSAGGGTVRLSQFAGHNVLVDFYEGYW